MKKEATIETLEYRIALFLRRGVFLAGTLMFIGWMGLFSWDENPFYHYSQYDQIPFIDLLAYHIRRKDWAFLICYAGLSVLILLPLIRVLLTCVLFLKQKEKRLAIIAWVVFLSLIFSMLLGIDL